MPPPTRTAVLGARSLIAHGQRLQHGQRQAERHVALVRILGGGAAEAQQRHGGRQAAAVTPWLVTEAARAVLAQPELERAQCVHVHLGMDAASTTLGTLMRSACGIYLMAAKHFPNLDLRISLPGTRGAGGGAGGGVEGHQAPAKGGEATEGQLVLELELPPADHKAWESPERLDDHFNRALDQSDYADPLGSSAAGGRGWTALGLGHFKSCVVGGTFDGLHLGHKLLLTLAAGLSSQRLTVGVTSESMLRTKTLGDLIPPLGSRIAFVRDFLETVAPHLIVGSPSNQALDAQLAQPSLDITVLQDPIGPAGTDPFCSIVATDETFPAVEMINAKRESEGRLRMSGEAIPLVNMRDVGEAPDLWPWRFANGMGPPPSTSSQQGPQVREVFKDDKVSSTVLRLARLGSFRDVQGQAPTSSVRRVIGLTGGIASGKSSIAEILRGLGAVVLDCDKFGHESYLPGTKSLESLVRVFGEKIRDGNGAIDRKALGQLVFGNKANLAKLNAVVWPAIGEKIEEALANIPRDRICVIDAAVLFEAGWDKYASEVWTAFVPRDEAVARIMARNNLSAEQAAARVDAQISARERIARSNVVISSFWERAFTRAQVMRAWNHESLPQHLDQPSLWSA